MLNLDHPCIERQSPTLRHPADERRIAAALLLGSLTGLDASERELCRIAVQPGAPPLDCGQKIRLAALLRRALLP